MKYNTATRGTSATVEVPTVEFYDDDGNLVATGDEATAAMLAHLTEQQAKRQEALEELRRANEAAYDGWALQKQLAGERWEASPSRKAKVAAHIAAMERGESVAAPDLEPEWEEAERWACAEVSRRAGAGAGFELVREPGVTYVRATRAQTRRGRSPRPATNDRRRGSRRSSVRRSSERSGDSGEGSEPPGRTCACGCDLDISHRAPQARYASDAHAAYARQRRKREREREHSKLRPEVSGRDPYLRFDLDPPKRFEDLLARVEAGCRCNGHHLADADDGHCLKCGHRRGWALPSGKTIPARSAETRRPRKAEVIP